MGLSAFGLGLLSDVPLPGVWQPRPLQEPSLQIQLSGAAEIEDSWSGFQEIGWQGLVDGALFVVERGVGGDHRFVHGAQPELNGCLSSETRAVHHLLADASVLRCAPAERADPAWWRVVLDSVLFTVALLKGYEALHAGAIATPHGAIAITATTGGGKSTLLAELLACGQTLMADDVLVLEHRGNESPVAHPAPPLMTVPMSSKAASLETILSLDGERWVTVPVFPEPLALKAMVVLDRRGGSRRPGGGATLTKIDDLLAPLLHSLMRFPRSPERERARFELASAMASEVGLWRLTADLETPARVLADTLLAGAL